MWDFEALQKLGEECGFTHVAPLDVATIELREDVRGMCASGRCSMYGTRWSCPPGCGSLEDCRARVRGYEGGILVQTVGELEDELDGEGMMELEARHKANFDALHRELRARYPKLLALGAGACTRCRECSYPDAPCRFPTEMVSSMEAYGMLVLQICKDNNLTYYYGKNTLAYTSCFLVGAG